MYLLNSIGRFVMYDRGLLSMRKTISKVVIAIVLIVLLTSIFACSLLPRKKIDVSQLTREDIEEAQSENEVMLSVTRYKESGWTGEIYCSHSITVYYSGLVTNRFRYDPEMPGGSYAEYYLSDEDYLELYKKMIDIIQTEDSYLMEETDTSEYVGMRIVFCDMEDDRYIIDDSCFDEEEDAEDMWEEIITFVEEAIDEGEYVTGYCAYAPIIYLYPEQTEQISVSLDLEGELTTTYPLYEEENNEGWNVTATPEGVLTDSSGRHYSYLFWEAILDMEPDLSRGFCVAREDTIEFLETALNEMGLNEEEANGFIMYWLPQLEANEYNYISFQTESYEEAAGLEIEPQPDTVIRVFMMWGGVDHYIEVEPQDLTAMNPSEREGFTVVEWGGTELEDLDLSSIS